MRVKATLLLGVAGLLAVGVLGISDRGAPLGPRAADPGPTPSTGPPSPSVAAESVTPSDRAEPVAVHAQVPPGEAADSELRDEMESLLAALRRQQLAGRSTRETVFAIGALLREHPEMIRVLIDVVEGSDERFKGLLIQAVVSSGNRRLRATLSAAIALAADDGQKQVRELLTSAPVRIADAIRDLPNPRDRRDLVRGLTGSQLTDSRILAALDQSARSDSDPQVRRSSLIRLGKSGDARGRALVLQIIEDKNVDSGDRAAAALALGGRSTGDDWTVFVDILHRPDEPRSVRKLAANGLSQFVGRPEVDKVLFGLLECRDEDREVRKVSAATIALGGLRLKGDPRDELEERAHGALLTLEGQAGSEDLLAWSRSQFADSFGPEFRLRLQPPAESQSSVSTPGD